MRRKTFRLLLLVIGNVLILQIQLFSCCTGREELVSTTQKKQRVDLAERGKSNKVIRVKNERSMPFELSSRCCSSGSTRSCPSIPLVINVIHGLLSRFPISCNMIEYENYYAKGPFRFSCYFHALT
ncbi:unnamed protein product [Calicophoron daubneyi]|uniref:Uncharacterized protein n=1 Tax=Calicophoron daubneyi TaxID=300641 RepID=A0AAV2TMF1_CALDB